MGKLKSARSAQEYCELLVKSQLLDEASLEKARKLAEQTDDAKLLARTLIKREMLTQWQAQQLLAGWHQLKMGKYKLYDQIGRSDLGRTFAAEHPQMGRDVAIKALASRHATNPAFVKRFLTDAREAAALDHRNIIHVYDVSAESDRYYVVMELADGQTLRQMVADEGALDQQTVAEYIRQAALGLAYAHERGVIHRDVKPDNLLVDRGGTLKILDMGVGRFAEHPGEAESSEAAEACAFEAPEQRSNGAEVDQRADIYALGQTARFLLAGHVPTGDSNGQPSELAPELAALFGKMVAADPNERTGSLAEVLKILDAWLAENAFQSEKPEPPAVVVPAVDVPAVDVPAATAGTTDNKAEKPAAPSFDFLGAEKPAASAEGFNWSPTGGGEKAKSKPAAAAPAPEKASAAANPSEPIVKPASKPSTKPTIKPTEQDAAKTKQAEAARPVSATPKSAKSDPAAALPKALPKAKMKKAAKPAVADKAKPDSPKAPAPLQVETKPKSAAAAPGGFAVNVKKGRTKPAPAAVAAASAPAAAESDEDASPSTAKKPLPMKMIIAGAAIAAVLLIALVGGLTYVLFSGDKTQPVVADASDASPSEVAVVQKPPADDEEDLEGAWRDAELPATTPAPGTTGIASADASAAAPSAIASSDEATVTAAAVAAAPDPAAEEAAPAAAETATAAADADSPPEAAVETTPPKADPIPKPAAPARNPKWDKPFAALPKLVELPAIDENATPEPFELGLVTSDPNEFVRIQLIGGENALKGRGTFDLQNADNGTAERDWEIRFSGAGDSSPVIATMSLTSDDKLVFQWTAAGIAEPLATNLRNCMLHMEVSQKEHDLALRSVVPVEPITFGLLKAMPVVKINLDSPPDPDRLKIEVLRLDGPFPKFTSDPNQPISATNGTQSILFGEKVEDQILFVRMDSSWKGKGIELKFAPFLRVPGVTTPQRFIFGKLPQLKQGVQTQVNIASAQLGQVMEMEKQIKDPQQRSRLGLGAKKQLAEQAQQQAFEIQNQFDKLEKLVQAVGDGGQLHLRVFYDVDGTQIDIARTDVAAPP